MSTTFAIAYHSIFISTYDIHKQLKRYRLEVPFDLLLLYYATMRYEVEYNIMASIALLLLLFELDNNDIDYF